MPRFTASVGTVLFLATWIHANPAFSAPQYRVEQIGDSHTHAQGLNNLGQVVGNAEFDASGIDIPFIYFHGQLRALSGFGSSNASASSINDRGEIGGAYLTGNAFIWRQGNITDVNALLGSRQSYSAILNQNGHATGNADFKVSAYYYDGNSARYILRDQPAPYASNGLDINDKDEIVGSITFSSSQNDRAYLWSKGSYTLLPTLGGDFNIAFGINNAGQITGSSTTADGHQLPFLYSDGVLHNLGTLGGDVGIAYSINNRGAVVGETYNNSIPLSGTGFLYQDGQMYDLNSLLSAAAREKWSIRDATDINDRGQILANTTNGYSLLLTPVPEPQTALLLMVGLTAIGCTVRRSKMDAG